MDSMDEEIQYLGTKFAPPSEVNMSDPCPGSRLPGVTGITLHVDKCSEKLPHDLTFLKSLTSFVNIGRKSSAEDKALRKENDEYNAVFPCQVVSGKHARLLFSDGGQVYIVDLDSRHGTHLRRRDETVSKSIQPHVSTVLADGDIVTFGKSVGAGSYLVSPVSVRVELLRGPPAKIPPIRSLSEPVSETDSSHDPTEGAINPSRSSSGRYGVFIPPSPGTSSHSDSSSSYSISSSENDSDVEEISTMMPADNNRNESGHNNGFNISVPGIRAVFDDVFRLHPHAFAHLLSSSPHHSPPVQDIDSIHTPIPDVRDDVSESHSAMELSTPSPAPSVYNVSEPDVIGAWFTSRSPSRASSRPPTPCISRLPSPSAEASASDRVRVSQEASAYEPESQKGNISNLPPVSNPPLDDRQMTSPVINGTSAADKEAIDIHWTRMSLRDLQDDLSDIRHTLVDMDSGFQSNTRKLRDMDERMNDATMQSSEAVDRVSSLDAQFSALYELRDQVNSLSERCDALQKNDQALGEIKDGVDALHALVAEMKALRNESEKEASLKLQSMQDAHADALSAIACEVKTFANLKRKHSEVELKTADIEVVNIDDEDTVMALTPQALPPVQTVVDDDVMEPSPSKRARKGVSMSGVAHTATAFAFGAVATWSVLAFS